MIHIGLGWGLHPTADPNRGARILRSPGRSSVRISVFFGLWNVGEFQWSVGDHRLHRFLQSPSLRGTVT